MPKLPVAAFIISSIMTVILSGSLVVDAFAQNIIGYSESKITVESEKTYCISSRTLQLTDVHVRSIEGNRIENTTAGSQILIEASVTSNCEISNYPILILAAVADSEGMTRYVSIQNTTMSQGDQTTIGFSWMPSEAGDYELTVLAHACLNCSGDFGLIERIDFSVIDQPIGKDEYIDLTISGLKSTYQTGERIIFTVGAKGISDNACNIGSPSVYMRDESNGGKIIYWPNPFALYTAMGCNGPDPIDEAWTYGDEAKSETILEKPGSYILVASLEDAKIEKNFVVTS